MPVYLLTDEFLFPPPHMAAESGLVAVGGDLRQKRLLLAYRMGIFPWFSDSEPILWWSPDPRLVLYPNQLYVSRSLQKVIKRAQFKVTLDLAFEAVIKTCASTRRKHNGGTWIGEEMIAAYCRLHESGFAHSVESWYEDRLVGGLYGVSLGKCFFGESMFAKSSNASKVALVALVRYLQKQSFDLIDCQVTTSHMMRFGACEISRRQFLMQIRKALVSPTLQGKWHFGIDYFRLLIDV